MKRQLITTAIQSTWPDKKQPVKFLGDWCLLYSKKKIYESFDYEIYEYHWNDRIKLKNDYKKLSLYYENELNSLVKILNQKHNVKYSIKFWRILIGPWLGYFIHILYDRWSMLKLAVESGEVSSVTIVDRNSSDLIPQDMKDFCSLRSSDDWNEMIFAELLSISFRNNIEIKKVIQIPEKSIKSSLFSKIRTHLSLFKERVLSIIIKPFVSRKEYFFKSTTFSLLTLIKIQIKLGFIPKLWRSKTIPHVKRGRVKRSTPSLDIGDTFEEVLHVMIYRHMPFLYFERYDFLKSLVSQLAWPSEPKAIFTHVGYEQDDLFKQWAAEKVEKGSKFILGQHGGHYGIGLFSFPQDHEVAISDNYLTWGWDDASSLNINKSVFQKPLPKNLKHDPSGKLLIVMYTMPRYMHLLFSAALSSQWLDYYNDQVELITLLPESIRSQSIARTSSNDYDWDLSDRLKSAFRTVSIDDGVKDIKRLIANSRLYVATYNATTYLETLLFNIPTIIFWDPKRWELNEDVIPYFDQLEAVGIFHKCPKSAVNKINTVWDDVDYWWYSDKVQNARASFCSRFANAPENLVDRICMNITQIHQDDHIA